MGLTNFLAGRRGGLCLLAWLILALLPAAARASGGTLDPTFASGGKAVFHFRGFDGASGIAEQPDGKAVLVGEAAPTASFPGNCAVARLNANGSLDGSFGTGGETQVSFGGDDACFSAAIEPGGKVVVAGKTTVSGVDQWALARLNANGSLDSGFGSGGKAIITWGAGGARVQSVLVQPDGGIIVAGTTASNATQTDFTVVRLASNGTIDTSFGSGGHTTVDFGGDDHLEAAALQPDGRIVLAGDSTAGMSGHDFAAARLNPDGSVDTSFGSGGTSRVDFGGDDGANAVVVQPDGKVLLAGTTTNAPGSGDFALVRLTANGSLDPAFGSGGKTTVDFGGTDDAFGIALQDDGSVVVAGGTLSTLNAEQFAVAHLSSAGALDATFGAGGKATIDFGGVSVGHGVVVQGDGKIVVAGVSGANQFAAARLLGGSGGGGGGGGSGPPLIHCGGGRVLAFVSHQWRCTRVAGTDDSLLLTSADVPGYRSAGGGAGTAQAALSDPVPGAVRRGTAHGVSFRAGRRTLSVGVFTFSSSGRAASALRSLARGRRGVALGHGVRGLVRVRLGSRSTNLAIAFQVGAAVGAVRLQASGRIANASRIAAAYASELAVRLRRVLSLTSWQRTLDGIGPDGSFTPRLALQAFSLAFGPVPGVRTPAGSPGRLLDGTEAIHMVTRVWSRLSAAQHAAINRFLEPRIAHSASDAHPADAPIAMTPNARYQAMADKYNAIYRTKMPFAPPVRIKAFTVSVPMGKNGSDLMNAFPVDANGNQAHGQPAYCRVLVTPLGAGRADLDRQMAHEIFHCYTYVLDTNWPALAPWIVEGMAEWAAASVTQSDSIGWLHVYMQTPTAPLFGRSYAAVGFWGHADEVGGRGSLWAKIPSILNAGSNEASYAAAGGNGAGFVTTWASAAFRFSAAGQAWNQTDPLPLSINDPTVAFDSLTDSSNLISAPYALHEYNVTPNADSPLVEVVGLIGTVRAGTTRTDFGPIIKDFYCLGGKCECPPGDDGTVPDHQTVPNLWLAVTGGASIGDGQVIYHSMDEYCHPKEPGGGGGGGGGAGPPGLQIRSLQDLSVLGTISSGSCSFTGSSFTARGSGSGYSFSMRIANAHKPGQYLIPNNSGSTYVKVRRGGAVYSTQGRNTTVLGVTGQRDAGAALIKTRRVRVGKRTVIRYRISVGIDDLTIGGQPGVVMIPGPGGLAC